MNINYQQTSIASITKQRNLALSACVITSIANVVLVISLVSSDEKWVLIPQFNDEHHVEITSSSYSDQYIEDWASAIVNNFKCANPDSIDWKIHKILKITSSHGPLKEKLEQEAARIKKDRISTAFYPASYQIFQDKRMVEVTGEHSTWFGSDTIPIISPRKYRLSWIVKARGVIFLENFTDITDEEKPQ